MAVIEVDGLRGARHGRGPAPLTLAGMAAIIVVATAVAARRFGWE